MKPENLLFEYNFRTFSDWKYVLKSIANLFLNGINENLYYRIEISKKYKKRTLQQNKLYWGYILPFIYQNDQNFSIDQLHLLFRARFLQKIDISTLDLMTGLVFEQALQWNYTTALNLIINDICYSTTELKTVQFNKYIDDIVKLASVEFRINIDLSEESIQKWKNEVNMNRK